MGEGGSSAAVVREGSRLVLPLNKQRVIVRQVVRLSCSAGSALFNPSTPPTPPAHRLRAARRRSHLASKWCH